MTGENKPYPYATSVQIGTAEFDSSGKLRPWASTPFGLPHERKAWADVKLAFEQDPQDGSVPKR